MTQHRSVRILLVAVVGCRRLLDRSDELGQPSAEWTLEPSHANALVRGALRDHRERHLEIRANHLPLGRTSGNERAPDRNRHVQEMVLVQRRLQGCHRCATVFDGIVDPPPGERDAREGGVGFRVPRRVAGEPGRQLGCGAPGALRSREQLLVPAIGAQS